MTTSAPAPHLFAKALRAIGEGKALKAAARAIASDRLRALKTKTEEVSIEIMRALTRSALAALSEARAAYLLAKKEEEEEQARRRREQASPPKGGASKAAESTESSRSDGEDGSSALTLLKTWAVAAVGRAALAVTQAWSALTGRGKWRWRTQRDERVRPEHRALEGRVFRSGERHPVEGLPSEAFGCRCWMEPI